MSAVNIIKAENDILRLDKVFSRKDVSPEDAAILDDKPEVPTDEEQQDHPLTNEASFTANTADFSSPVSRRERDITDLQKSDPTEDPLIQRDNESDPNSIFDPETQFVPSAVVDYYNESAMKAKKRNSLPDEEFGLPRLRAYPLNDKAHVQQAIRMFGHCKDPKDRKTLASRIFTAMDKHGVTTKIGKGNALYEYAPENLREAVSLTEGFSITAEDPKKLDPEVVKKCGEEANKIAKGCISEIKEVLEFLVGRAEKNSGMKISAGYKMVTPTYRKWTPDDLVTSEMNIGYDEKKLALKRIPLLNIRVPSYWYSVFEWDFDKCKIDDEYLDHFIGIADAIGRAATKRIKDKYGIVVDFGLSERTYHASKSNQPRKATVDMTIAVKDASKIYNKSVNETGDDAVCIYGFEVPMGKRTKADIVAEHLKMNGSFYNNIFYGNAYANAAKGTEELEFLQYFYPDLKRMRFPIRLRCVCGGLAGESADLVYKALQIRAPLDTDFTKPLGWCEAATNEEIADKLELAVSSYYSANSNWFRVDLSNDLDHIYFCLRLYSVMGEILLDPNFSHKVNLTDKHQALLMDWGQRVGYHYDLYLEAKDGSNEQLKQIQYLFDLFWLFTDNPYSEDDISVNIISILNNMASLDEHVINMNEANTSSELVSKEKCTAYLVHDLGIGEDMYLLPGNMEYPIIDKNSIRLAMDYILKVPDELKKEFAENLNRKYREFGCTFSISVDHPYAPYADKSIIINMTQMLLEGDSVVDDEGSSSGKTNVVEDPWYKRHDIVKGVGDNILDNKELGPNTKPKQEPDYTPFDSVK